MKLEQDGNCSTISLCFSGCENGIAEPRSFARRQPPIQPVLNAPFLLMQRSGTHGSVKLTGAHLPALITPPVIHCSVFLENSKSKINLFLLIIKNVPD